MLKIHSSLKEVVLFASLMLFANIAHAAGGFAATASTALMSIKDGIVIIIGVVAILALIWQIAQGFMERKTWPEVFTTCAWILAAGAAPALASWLFTTGQSMTF